MEAKRELSNSIISWRWKVWESLWKYRILLSSVKKKYTFIYIYLIVWAALYELIFGQVSVSVDVNFLEDGGCPRLGVARGPLSHPLEHVVDTLHHLDSSDSSDSSDTSDTSDSSESQDNTDSSVSLSLD